MTETPPNRSSSSPTEQEAAAAPAPEAAEAPSFAPKFFKGCGCVTVCILLAVGVALAGNGDVESWGSGIAGVLILVFVVSTSGLTGWHKK
jgi:hypothetical protein